MVVKEKAVACDDDDLEISCPAGGYIYITNAWYGRQAIDVCTERSDKVNIHYTKKRNVDLN